MNVSQIITGAINKGACVQSSKATDWKSLVWLFFSPQGREFCRDNNYPSIELFRSMKQYVEPYGVFVENPVEKCNEDIALIGESDNILHYDGVDKAYKVILMHGARAKIYIRNYSVVRIENISGSYEIINVDKTGEALI